MKHFAHPIHALILAVICLCFLLPAEAAHSAEDNKTITLSVPKEGWPPFIITDGKRESHGIMIDVLQEVVNRTGMKLEIAHYPEMRSQMMLKSGDVDIQAKALEWVSEPSIFQWTDPVVDSTDVMIFCKQDEHLINKPLKGLSIGAILGYGYPTLAPLAEKGVIRRYNASNTANLLHMLQHGHIHAAVTNRHVAEWIILNSGNLSPDQFAYGQAVDSVPYRFALTKARSLEGFRDQFNKELAAMKHDGRLQAIMDRYH